MNPQAPLVQSNGGRRIDLRRAGHCVQCGHPLERHVDDENRSIPCATVAVLIADEEGRSSHAA